MSGWRARACVRLSNRGVGEGVAGDHQTALCLYDSITVVCASFAPCVGFLNFKLDDSYVLSSLQSVAMNGLPAPRYVTRHCGADLQAVVQCVSVSPTLPCRQVVGRSTDPR